jgi:hypothetical protein
MQAQPAQQKMAHNAAYLAQSVRPGCTGDFTELVMVPRHCANTTAIAGLTLSKKRVTCGVLSAAIAAQCGRVQV